MKIECTFDSKIFHNPMNKYCIFRMKTDDPLIPKEARGDRIYPDHLIRFSAVGYELPMTDVVKLVLEGDWEKGKYGLQFVVEQWHEIVPETESGVYNYLSSGLLKGIGSKTAAEIVARFGVNALKVIENTPEKLLEIRGITPERLEEIKLSYAESRALRDIMTLLSPFKLTPKAALRIYQHLGPASLEILQKSPYSLCRIPGFGFARVDAIMQKNDCDLHDPMRVQGALFCALDNAGNDGGHLFVEKTKLVEGATTLLNGKIPVPALRVKKEEIEEALNSMVLEGTVVCARDNIYHPRVFAQEDTVAQIISKILIEKPPHEYIQPILEKVKADFQIRLSEKQEVAVNEAFRNNLSIITGSPGTGKTTVLKTILEVYRRLYPEGKVRLMAPTGRASRNMAESTGFKDARTMHNALGLISEEDDGDTKNGNGPLDADLIIVDEFSMVDMWLAYKFFSRIRKGTKLVLVGDPDQLPSVRPGNVFKEMIASGIIPVTVLNQIFRQSKDSFIAHNAKIINRGETTLYYGDDFQFINAKTQEETAMIIMELYCQEVYEHGIENVQILSPFRHKGDASSDQMNATLREIINPFTSDEDEIRVGGTSFRVGDRIMQNKNTSQVSNGDLGFIRGVDNSSEVRHPEGRIRVNPLRITEQIAIYEAQVYLNREDPAPVCSFTSSISKDEAPDGKYIQAAQEDAIDKALTDAGFGIQLSDVTMPESMRHYGSEIPVSQLNGNASVTAGQVKATQPVSKPVVQAPSAPEQSATAIQQSPAPKVAERPVQVTQNVAPAQPNPAPKAVQPTAPAQPNPAPKAVQPTAPVQTAPAANVVKPTVSAPTVKAPAQTVAPQTADTAPVVQPTAVAQPKPVVPVREQPKPAQEVHAANAALEVLRGGNPAPVAPVQTVATTAPAAAAEADDKDLPFTFGPAYNNSMTPEEIAAVMTLDQAKAVVVDTGVCKGMTMGEVAEKRPVSLKFYIFGGYRGDNNILKAAAKVIYEQLQTAA